jgi:hypothetical protein
LTTSVLFSGQDIPPLNPEQQRRVDWILEFAANKSDLARDIRDFDLLVTRGRIRKHLGFQVVGSWDPKKKADSGKRKIPEEFPREMFPKGKKVPERKKISERELNDKKKSPEKRKLPERKVPEKKILPGKEALEKEVPVRAVSKRAVPEMDQPVIMPVARREPDNLESVPAEARTRLAVDKGKGKVTVEKPRHEKENVAPKMMSSAMRSSSLVTPPPKKVKPTIDETCGASNFQDIIMLQPGAPSKVLPPKSNPETLETGGEKRSRDEGSPDAVPEKRRRVDHARYFDEILGRHFASHSLPDLGDVNIAPTGPSLVAPTNDKLSGSSAINGELPSAVGASAQVISSPLEEEVSAQVLGEDQPHEVTPSPEVASVECSTRETSAVGGSDLWGPLLSSLGEGLTEHPLQVLSNIIPHGHSRGDGRVSSEEFVDLLIHQKITVSFVYCVSIFSANSSSLLTLVFSGCC